MMRFQMMITFKRWTRVSIPHKSSLDSSSDSTISETSTMATWACDSSTNPDTIKIYSLSAKRYSATEFNNTWNNRGSAP